MIASDLANKPKWMSSFSFILKRSTGSGAQPPFQSIQSSIPTFPTTSLRRCAPLHRLFPLRSTAVSSQTEWNFGDKRWVLVPGDVGGSAAACWVWVFGPGLWRWMSSLSSEKKLETSSCSWTQTSPLSCSSTSPWCSSVRASTKFMWVSEAAAEEEQIWSSFMKIVLNYTPNITFNVFKFKFLWALQQKKWFKVKFDKMKKSFNFNCFILMKCLSLLVLQSVQTYVNHCFFKFFFFLEGGQLQVNLFFLIKTSCITCRCVQSLFLAQIFGGNMKVR